MTQKYSEVANGITDLTNKLQFKIEEQSHEIESLSAENVNLRRDYDEVAASKEVLMSEYDKNLQNVRGEVSKLSDLENANNLLKVGEAQLNNKISILDNQLSEKTNEIESLRKKREKFGAWQRELEKAVQTSDQEKEEMSVKLKALSPKYKESVQNVSGLNSKLASLRQEYETAVNEKESLTNKMKSLVPKYKESIQSVNDLTIKLSEKESLIGNLQIFVNDNKLKYESLSNQYLADYLVEKMKHVLI